MGKMYGYVRVSSRDQCEERQLVAMREFGVSERNIYADKLSGKNFEKPQYKCLVQGRRCACNKINRQAWAKLHRDKGNPRCLRKLYLVTREQIRLSLMPLAEQAHEQMIDAEQFAIGWKKKKSS